MLISAYCVFRVANRYTFRAIFSRDLGDRARRQHYRRVLGDVVVAYLTSSPEPDLPDRTRRSRSASVVRA
jgi:tetracycline repressor-like protein